MLFGINYTYYSIKRAIFVYIAANFWISTKCSNIQHLEYESNIHPILIVHPVYILDIQTLTQTFSFFLRLTILSRPLKAPDATNRMLVVSTGTLSPRSLRELRSGTLTMVPSNSFSMPCGQSPNTKWNQIQSETKTNIYVSFTSGFMCTLFNPRCDQGQKNSKIHFHHTKLTHENVVSLDSWQICLDRVYFSLHRFSDRFFTAKF